jgi:hypothetical protein
VIESAVPKFTVFGLVVKGLLVAEAPSASVLQKASAFQVPVELPKPEVALLESQ